MHFIGMAGLPRRYYENTNFPLFDDLQDVNVVITVFALVGGAFQLVFIYNFFSVCTKENNVASFGIGFSNYGIYFGNQNSGQVRRVSEGAVK